LVEHCWLVVKVLYAHGDGTRGAESLTHQAIVRHVQEEVVLRTLLVIKRGTAEIFTCYIGEEYFKKKTLFSRCWHITSSYKAEVMYGF